MKLKPLIVLCFLFSLAMAADLRISASLDKEAVDSGENVLLSGTVIYNDQVAEDVLIYIDTDWGEIHQIRSDENGHFETYLTPYSDEDEELEVKLSAEFYGETAEKELDILVEGEEEGETSTSSGMYRLTLKSPLIHGHRIVLRGEVRKDGDPWLGYVKIITPKLITYAKTTSDGTFEKTIYHGGEILFIAGKAEKKQTVELEETIFEISSFGNKIYGQILDYSENPVSGTLYVGNDAYHISFGKVNIEVDCGEHELLFVDRTGRISGEDRITLCKEEIEEEEKEEYIIGAEFLSYETENTTIRITLKDEYGKPAESKVSVEVSGEIYDDYIAGEGVILTRPKSNLQTFKITVGDSKKEISRVIEKSYGLSVEAPIETNSTKFEVYVKNTGKRKERDVFVEAETFRVGVGDFEPGRTKKVLVVLPEKEYKRVVTVKAKGKHSEAFDRVSITKSSPENKTTEPEEEIPVNKTQDEVGEGEKETPSAGMGPLVSEKGNKLRDMTALIVIGAFIALIL